MKVIVIANVVLLSLVCNDVTNKMFVTFGLTLFSTLNDIVSFKMSFDVHNDRCLSLNQMQFNLIAFIIIHFMFTSIRN